MVSVYYPY